MGLSVDMYIDGGSRKKSIDLLSTDFQQGVPDHSMGKT